MIRIAVAALAACLGVPAAGAEVEVGLAPGSELTVVELAQTEHGDWYVEMTNRTVNASWDEKTYTLDAGELAVSFEFFWQYEGMPHDAIRVTPPEGLSCVPDSCLVAVPENGVDRVWLVPAGTGM